MSTLFRVSGLICVCCSEHMIVKHLCSVGAAAEGIVGEWNRGSRGTCLSGAQGVGIEQLVPMMQQSLPVWGRPNTPSPNQLPITLLEALVYLHMRGNPTRSAQPQSMREHRLWHLAITPSLSHNGPHNHCECCSFIPLSNGLYATTAASGFPQLLGT